ncbi:MAG: aldehyde dehydrogenase family protein, partial [Rhizobiales bacterium]|nr:aldehyde dehydrogenase family protein [Hyphomicrobiales bacterium]
MFKKDCYINGVWVAGAGAEFCSIDPANEQVVWRGNAASDEQVEAAAKAAKAALNDWLDLGYDGRVEIVRKYRELVEENKLVIAEMISAEMGKALWDSQGEVAAMIGKIALSEQANAKRAGTNLTESAGFNSVLRHKAHGVVAIFGPYNFPCHLPNGHIVPALLAGNTILFKPSEITPKTGAFMVHLWDKAGIPKGVINLLQGEKQVGIALSNAKIDGLFFTGSSQTGKLIHETFGGRPDVMLALEMGGNNPLIVSEVEDIEAACYHIIQSAFISSGQRCTCARRLILPDGDVKADALLAKLVEMTKALRVGLWNDEEQPYMGPVVNGKVADGYIEAFDDLVARGGDALLAPAKLRNIAALVSPAIVDVTNVDGIED